MADNGEAATDAVFAMRQGSQDASLPPNLSTLC